MGARSAKAGASAGPGPDATAQQGEKPYRGREVTVTFDLGRCLHAGECVRGLPEAFDTAQRPWITPDGAPAESVAKVIRRCPSGALQYRLGGADANQHGPDETGDVPTTVLRTDSGRLVVRGDLRITTPSGVRTETRAVLCGCASTGNAPFCDHSGPCSRSRLGSI